MTEEQFKVDAMLAVAAQQLAEAAEITQRMRDALRTSDNDAALLTSQALHECMGAVEHIFQESARLIQMHNAAQLAVRGIMVQSTKGGWIH